MGEMIRDDEKHDNKHVVVFLDDMTPLRRLWQRAGDMISRVHKNSNESSSTMEDLTEMRHYYSPLLQRAACMSNSRGGGTMSILASMPYDEEQEGNEQEFVLDDLTNIPPSVRERLSIIRDRGIELNVQTLRKIGLEMYVLFVIVSLNAVENMIHSNTDTNTQTTTPQNNNTGTLQNQPTCQ